MNKKVLIIFLIIAVIAVLVTMYISKRESKNVADSNNRVVDDIVKNNDIENNTINEMIENGEVMNNTIKVNINNKIYTALIEQNEAAKQFTNILPQEFKMSELNGNEKYVYLDNTFTTDSYSPKHIEAGDIMLFGNNCLVVFYESFDTSYTYTKIGHIEGLPDLGSENITVRFEK